MALDSMQADSQHERELMTTIMAADGASSLSLPAETGGSVSLMYSVDQESMILSASGGRELPDGSEYQLWLIGPDGPESFGLLAGPDAPVTVQGPMNAVAGLGVTVEPAGGSEQPTSDTIVSGDL